MTASVKKHDSLIRRETTLLEVPNQRRCGLCRVDRIQKDSFGRREKANCRGRLWRQSAIAWPNVLGVDGQVVRKVTTRYPECVGSLVSDLLGSCKLVSRRDRHRHHVWKAQHGSRQR